MRFDHSSGQYLDREGARIYFEATGASSGRTVVLLHGGLGSLKDFNSFLGLLPPEFRYVGIDFRGHGRSTIGREPLRYALYQEDVNAVVRHIGAESFSLVGFSDGGIVGYRIAAASGSRVDALFTLGAQWRLEADDPSREMLGGLTAPVWEATFPESVAHYREINPQPDFGKLVGEVVALWTDESPEGYPRESVAQILTPTLIARGDDDPLFSMDEALLLRDRIPGAGFFNIPFAGHDAFEDAPELFTAALSDFLRNPRKRQSEE